MSTDNPNSLQIVAMTRFERLTLIRRFLGELQVSAAAVARAQLSRPGGAMTAEEIHQRYSCRPDADVRTKLLAEIAAQLAEANELTRKTQELQQRQIEMIEKDFAFRSDPKAFTRELKASLDTLLSPIAPPPPPRTDPPEPPPRQFPKRRH